MGNQPPFFIWVRTEPMSGVTPLVMPRADTHILINRTRRR